MTLFDIFLRRDVRAFSTDGLTVFFALLGPAHIKTTRKTMVKLSPDV